MVSKRPHDVVGARHALSIFRFRFRSRRHECPGFGYNLRQTFGIPTRVPTLVHVPGVGEQHKHTSDPDTARPILPGPIPNSEDFVLVHLLAEVRRWMWMLQIQFRITSQSLQIRFAESLTRCGGKDMFVDPFYIFRIFG